MVAARPMTSANRTKGQQLHQYLATCGPRKTLLNVPKGEVIFSQGDFADSVFYIQQGRVKISVTSPDGKEATLALQSHGAFIGEECIAATQPLRLATAAAVLPCTVLRIDSREMAQALEADSALSQFFQSFLLTRCTLMQEDLIDHRFNSSEKRLARTLLLLSQLEDEHEATIRHMNQETLAVMIGTTRSRVSFFMNHFRKMGHIEYSGCNGGVKVHRSLFNVLLNS